MSQVNNQNKTQKYTSGGLGRVFAVLFLMLTMLLQGNVGFFTAYTAQAASNNPKLLNYQARITDSSGVPVADGSLSVKLAIYSSSSGASGCLWSASNTDATDSTIDCTSDTPDGAITVTVKDGVFSVVLGDTTTTQNALPDDIFDGDARYLGITVAADAEMTPRKRITSAPYAFNADRLDDLDTSNAGGTGAYVPVTDSSGNLTITGRGIFADQAGTPTENIFEIQNNGGSTKYFTQSSTSTLINLANSSGYEVGIGTAIPTAKLDVHGASGDTARYLEAGPSTGFIWDVVQGWGQSSIGALNSFDSTHRAALTIAAQDNATTASTQYGVYISSVGTHPSGSKSIIGAGILTEQVTAGSVTFNEGLSIIARNSGSASGGDLRGVTANAQIFTTYSDSSSVSSMYGGDFKANSFSNATIPIAYGLNASVGNGLAGTFTTAYGLKADLRNTAGGTITTGSGIYSTLTNSSTGTVTTAHRFYAANGTVGTTTNNYGLYLEDITGGTNNYAIFSAGGDSYLNDLLVVADGSATPTGNIFQVQNDNDSVRYLTVSSTNTRIAVGSATPLTVARTSRGEFLGFEDGTDDLGMFTSDGTPESSITADRGSLAVDTTNGALYVKTTDGVSTGWNLLDTTTANPDQLAIIVDQKSAGTDAGASSSTTTHTRVINTELYDPDGIVSISSNQFTLQAGTYHIKGIVPTFRSAQTQAYLYSVTDAQYDIIGGSAFSQTGGGSNVMYLEFEDVITIASAKTFEVRHFVTNAQSANGLGAASNNGENEIYTHVTIRKLQNSGTATPSSRIQDADNNTFIEVEATTDVNQIRFSTETSGEVMRILDSGYIGFGTTAPTANLALTAGTAPTSNIFEITNDDGTGFWTSKYFTVSSTNTTSTVQSLNQDGSVSAPAYSFASTPDMGMYRNTSSVLSLVTGGAQRVQISAQGVLSGVNGSASQPSFTRISDPNTGMYFGGSDDLIFATGGVEAMRLDPSQYVGIGISSPDHRLVVADSTTTNTIFEVVGVDALANADYTTKYFSVSSTSTQVLGDLTITGTCTGCGGGSTTLQQAYDNDVDGSDVTITTNSTDGALIIAGDQAFNFTSTGDVNFDTNTFFLDSSANDIGIGTITPTTKLHVAGDTGTAPTNSNTFFAVSNSSAAGDHSAAAIISGTSGIASLSFGDSASQFQGYLRYDNLTDLMEIWTGGTSKVTIASDGDFNVDSNTLFIDASTNEVGIGTTSPSSILHVAGDTGTAPANASTFLTVSNSSAAGDDSVINAISGTAGIAGLSLGDSASQFQGYVRYDNNTDGMELWTAGSAAIYIDSSGNVGIGESTPASLFTVGAGDTFQVDSSGNIVKINNVTYSWPASQAAGSGYYISNDGAGNLTWADSSGLGATSLQGAYENSTSTPATIDLNATRGGIRIADEFATLGTNLFEITDSNAAGAYTSKYFTVSSTSTAVGLSGADTNIQFQVANDGLAIGAFSSYSNTSTNDASLYLLRGRGTHSNRAVVQSGDSIGKLRYAGQFLAGGFNTTSYISAEAAGTFSGTSTPSDLIFATTPTGSTTPVERLRIVDSGDVDIDSNSLYVDASADGVGFGTNAPDAPIHAFGTSGPVLKVERSAAFTVGAALTADFLADSTGDMVDGFGSVIRFLIEDTANTENSTAWLGGFRDGADDSGELRFTTYSGGSETTHLFIEADGDVGIGEANPDARLTVADASGTPTGNIFEVWNNGGSSKYLTVSSTSTNIAGDLIISGTCTGCASLQSAYDSGDTIEIGANGSVILTETGAGSANDFMQLTALTTSANSGDLLQLTMDSTTASGFTGAGLRIVVDQSQSTGNPIHIESDSAAEIFTVGEAGSIISRKSGGSADAIADEDGYQLLWTTDNGAFRAGNNAANDDVTGSGWDQANLGQYSAAFGFGTTADSQNSFAAGESTSATNLRATAFGGFTLASGTSATALGYATTASGDESLSIGESTVASGDRSLAGGFASVASGLNSFAFGGTVSATNTNDFAFGSGIKSTGSNSYTFGETIGGSSTLINDEQESFVVGFDKDRPSMVLRGTNPSLGTTSTFDSNENLLTIMGQTYSSATGAAADAESHDVFFDLNRTRNFNSGALIAAQRAVYVGAPTYTFANAAQTITEAATFAIEGAPVAGTNATLTNTSSLLIESGTAKFNDNTILGSASATDRVTFNSWVASNIAPSADATYDLGNHDKRWKDLWLSGSTIHIGADGDEGTIGYNTTSNKIEFGAASGGVSIPGDLTISGTCTGCGGSSTLQGAYDGGTAQPHITLTSTDGTFSVRDNATPLATNLLSISDSTGNNPYFLASATNTEAYSRLSAPRLDFTQVIQTPGAPTTALGGAGNINDFGTGITYKITFVTEVGETLAGTASSPGLSPSNQSIDLTNIPTGSGSKIIARNIYRAGGIICGAIYKQVGTISDNTTTTFNDNQACASETPGTVEPAGNTTGGVISLSDTDLMQFTSVGTTANGPFTVGDGTGIDTFTLNAAGTTTTDAFSITGGVTTGDFLSISANSVTSGSAINVSAGSNFTGGLIRASGSSFSGDLLELSSSGASDPTGSFIKLDSSNGSCCVVDFIVGISDDISTNQVEFKLRSNGEMFMGHNPANSTAMLHIADSFDSGLRLGHDTMMLGNNFTLSASNTIVIDSEFASINLLLGGGVGDDFNVNSDTLVVESDTNKVGIGTASPARTLEVVGNVQLSLSGLTQTTNGLCHTDAGATANQDVVDCSGAPSDVAEFYPVAGTVAAADILVATDNNLEYTEELFDPYTGQKTGETVNYNVSILEKTSEPYSDKIIGVYSTSPWRTFGESVTEASSSTAPVGLTGRVPTRVVLESGVIKAGDPITTSSTAGAGMKATKPGMIVGHALEGWSGPGEGVINVLLAPSWHSGATIGTDGTMSLFEDDFTFNTTDIATASGDFGSRALKFRASAWDAASNTAVTRDITMSNTLTDKDTYDLTFLNNDQETIANLGENGDFYVAGKLFPSDRGTLQEDKYIFYDGSVGPGGDMMRTNAAGWSTGSYDFAEMFPTREGDTLEAGTIVIADTENDEGIIASGSAYQNTILGIISTKPGFLAGENKEGDMPVALIGRVPTKVNLEGGVINIGDPITSSSEEGVGMRATEAGRVVGIALEKYDDSSEDNLITVYVNPSWYNGPRASSDEISVGSALTIESASIVDFQMSTLTNVDAILSASGMWSIGADGHFVAKHIETDVLKAKEIVLTATNDFTTTGEGVVKDGYNAEIIQNPAAHPNSRVFVSFLGNPGTGHWIGERGEGDFTVHLASPAIGNLEFEYWILNIDDQRSPESAEVVAEPDPITPAEGVQVESASGTPETSLEEISSEAPPPEESVPDPEPEFVSPLPAEDTQTDSGTSTPPTS